MNTPDRYTAGDRIWLKRYPVGVPADIVLGNTSLVDLLEESFAKFSNRKAFILLEKSITYRDLDEMSLALATFLQARGVRKGASIAVMMPNVMQSPVSVAAVLRAGGTVVNVNPVCTPRELEYQLRDSGAEGIVLLEDAASTVKQVLTQIAIKHVIIGTISGLADPAHVDKIPGAVGFSDAVKAGRSVNFNRPEIGPDDVAFLQYTGGTTGVSKGATLLHRNIGAHVLQMDAWLPPALGKPPQVEQLLFVCALPLYHIFALSTCFLLAMRVGGVNLLIHDPRDMPGFIKELTQYRFNVFPAVNTLFNGLLHAPGFDQIDFSGLKVSIGGGAAIQRAVADAWFEKTGCVICEAYGLSETSPGLTCNPIDTDIFSGSVGLPFPSTEISIRDDDGREVPLGETGEICAKGPQVMPGYWNRPDETAKAMTEDGYFRTGDIGLMTPEGSVRIIDRKKDMILVSGFNVYPNEIEGVIASYPGVLECAVIGVEDLRSGEAVKAFIVKKDPALSAESVIAFCRTQLSAYKIPKQIEFRDVLPKSNVGKTLRRELRNENGP